MDVGTSQPDGEYDVSGLLYPPNPGLWSVQGFPVNHRFPPEQLLRFANPRFCLNHVRSRWESEVTGEVPNGLRTELAHMAGPACVDSRGSSLSPRGFRAKPDVREPEVGAVRQNVDAFCDDVAVLFPVEPRPDSFLHSSVPPVASSMWVAKSRTSLSTYIPSARTTTLRPDWPTGRSG